MLKLNETSKREPFGGHHHIEYGITFRADSFTALVEKVSSFRLQNNIPVGNPEQEILSRYAQFWPWLVRQERDAEPLTDRLDYREWRYWLQKTWRTPPAKLITTREARDRWVKCQTCPANLKKTWDESDESSEVTRRAYLLRRGMDVPDYLGFCACHKTDLGVFTFIEAAKDYSARKTTEASPDGCWVI